MRRAARVDSNQAEIVAALRQVGAQVVSLAPMGNGVPDILCGFRGRNWLLEIKAGKGELTLEEYLFHTFWPGQAAVVYSVEDALEVIGAKDASG